MPLLNALLLLCCVSIAIAADGDAPLGKPTVKQGDSWSYRRIDLWTNAATATYQLKVTFAGPRAIQAVVKLEGNSEEVDSTWSDEWNTIADFNGRIFTPDSGVLKFPLRLGSSYKAIYEVSTPREGVRRSKNELTVRVVGWELITVPAGKFRALKLEAEGSYHRQDVAAGGRVRYVFWYVPEVKRWVKATYETTDWRGQPFDRTGDELIGFSLQ